MKSLMFAAHKIGPAAANSGCALLKVCKFNRKMPLFFLVCMLLFPRVTVGESLRIPTIVYGTAAASDWASTYYAVKYRYATERNPALRFLQDDPAIMIAVGAGMDVVGVWIWNRYAGAKHPMLAKWGLYIGAAMRLSFAVYNYRATSSICHGC
jgi:hypothetical protein